MSETEVKKCAESCTPTCNCAKDGSKCECPSGCGCPCAPTVSVVEKSCIEQCVKECVEECIKSCADGKNCVEKCAKICAEKCGDKECAKECVRRCVEECAKLCPKKCGDQKCVEEAVKKCGEECDKLCPMKKCEECPKKEGECPMKKCGECPKKEGECPMKKCPKKEGECPMKMCSKKSSKEECLKKRRKKEKKSNKRTEEEEEEEEQEVPVPELESTPVEESVPVSKILRHGFEKKDGHGWEGEWKLRGSARIKSKRAFSGDRCLRAKKAGYGQIEANLTGVKSAKLRVNVRAKNEATVIRYRAPTAENYVTKYLPKYKSEYRKYEFDLPGPFDSVDDEHYKFRLGTEGEDKDESYFDDVEIVMVL